MRFPFDVLQTMSLPQTCVLGLCLLLIGTSVMAEQALDEHVRVIPSALQSRNLEEVRLVMEQLKPRFFAVYREALQKDPHAAGKVVVQFTVAPSGKVADAQLVTNQISGSLAAEIEAGLIGVINTASFRDEDVARLIVTYPVEFSPS
jgi:hypothetical protein